MRKNILITGMPRSGKSTLLKKIISIQENKVGFVTNEVRKNDERVGFEIETNLGEKSALANVDFKTSFKVSKYFVGISNLDKIMPKVAEFNSDDFLYIDEIGQMELFSDSFKQLAIKYLDSQNTCIATLSKVYSDGFTEQVKNRDDVILIEISEENRDLKEKYIEALIKKISKAKKYISEPKRFSIKANNASINTDHGIRNLKKMEDGWSCDCEFFKENLICSHVIALEEYLKARG